MRSTNNLLTWARFMLLAVIETTVMRLRRGRARPSWGFVFECVVCALREQFWTISRWPYPRQRESLDSVPFVDSCLRRVARRSAELGGRTAYWFTPKGARPRAVVLFFHGGGYYSGSANTTHAALIARLALQSGVEVVGVDYRLAPEFVYPAALNDAIAAFDALLAGGREPAEIVVAGDSSGGNLALALQLALRERGGPQACAAVLISPWIDLTARRASCRLYDGLDIGHTAFLMMNARDFAGGFALEDARISPLNAVMHGLAPLLVQVGEVERVVDESTELVLRARDAGVCALLDVVADMPHDPPLFAQFHPQGQRALERLGQYIADRFDKAATVRAGALAVKG